ncbi:MAG: PH domain-containing protein [Holophagae bacterium]|jgi:putative membrane protein
MGEDAAVVQLTEEEIFAIERPDESLMTYYVIASLAAGPFFPFVLLPLYFRYHTMRYRFSEEGVSMRWGILFRKEINLTFSRIQDIHLTSNFVERWLGLARIQIQTASGSAKAEMTIEGLREARALRDFLYVRMRGAKGLAAPGVGASGAPHEMQGGGGVAADEVAAALREAAAELRAVRRALEARIGSSSDGEVEP